MAIALTLFNAPDGGDNTQRRTVLAGTAVLSGTYTTGGETIVWPTLNAVNGTKVEINTLFPTAPIWVEFVLGIPGSPATDILADYNYSTSKLQLYANATGLELASGFTYAGTGYASPAVLYFKAEFRAE